MNIAIVRARLVSLGVAALIVGAGMAVVNYSGGSLGLDTLLLLVMIALFAAFGPGWLPGQNFAARYTGQVGYEALHLGHAALIEPLFQIVEIHRFFIIHSLLRAVRVSLVIKKIQRPLWPQNWLTIRAI